MTEDEVEEKVKAVFTEILSVKPESVVPSARLVEDLQVTSIDQVDLLADFENAFGIQILDEEAIKVTTVGEMTALLKAKLREKGD